MCYSLCVPFAYWNDGFKSSPVTLLFKATIRKLEKDLVLGGMVVGTSGILLTLADDSDMWGSPPPNLWAHLPGSPASGWTPLSVFLPAWSLSWPCSHPLFCRLWSPPQAVSPVCFSAISSGLQIPSSSWHLPPPSSFSSNFETFTPSLLMLSVWAHTSAAGGSSDGGDGRQRKGGGKGMSDTYGVLGILFYS